MPSKSALAVILGLLICALSVRTSSSQASDPRSTVGGTVDSLIRYLRARQFTIVVTDFTAPDALKRMRQRSTLEQIVAVARDNGDFDRMLSACEAVSRLKPQLSKAGDIAVFEYVDKQGKKATFGLQRVGNRWYVF